MSIMDDCSCPRLKAENRVLRDALRCNKIHVGDMVTINQTSEYHREWRGKIVEVMGIRRYPGKHTLDYTIDDGTPGSCDGWQESELTKVPQQTTKLGKGE